MGITIYEMLFGDPPYIEYPQLRALFWISTSGVPPLKPNQFSLALSDFVNRCTAVNPQARADSLSLVSHSFVKDICTDKEFSAFVEYQI